MNRFLVKQVTVGEQPMNLVGMRLER
ncbi:hypothetical protein ZOSMA_70G00340 [Zostera marina]|uniref:Uncharacterized protein n=1 Tax=Zostera marina TaxID=29655 RepID=A0A0K9NSP4_ZOSMR|nr:hypothetical protein ZOSMA_70G00340 [Zostera marina]